tara:strand:- start:2040 stop:2786 length:747 start_codon:yes stop_codon:yes gene_type:complete
MYPPSYQDGIDATILSNPYKKLIGLRFSYGEHFDLLKSIKFSGRMVDFGCGNANFLINCNHHGFICDGVEYNSNHVAVLKKEITSANFFEVSEFLNSDYKYDLIRLSNVFEHFTDPINMLIQLKAKLKPNGYFLIEGPIETNFNIALQFRKIYFNIRKAIQPNRQVHHNPTHIIFTNRKNQQDILKKAGIKHVYFKIAESAWPFPADFSSANGFVQKLNVIIARISIQISKLTSTWGNTFIYLGQKEG